MLDDLWYIAVGSLFVLGIGGYANIRARRETARHQPLSAPTRAMMALAYSGLAVTIALAALTHALPIDLSDELTLGLRIAGLAFVLIGATIVIAVFAGSRKRTWDVDTDTLSTRGVYALSRNPRAVGWTAINVGLGLATTSGAVLALAAIFLLAYLPWILLEEVVLERHFGDQYRTYRARTRRFL